MSSRAVCLPRLLWVPGKVCSAPRGQWQTPAGRKQGRLRKGRRLQALGLGASGAGLRGSHQQTRDRAMSQHLSWSPLPGCLTHDADVSGQCPSWEPSAQVCDGCVARDLLERPPGPTSVTNGLVIFRSHFPVPLLLRSLRGRLCSLLPPRRAECLQPGSPFVPITMGNSGRSPGDSGRFEGTAHLSGPWGEPSGASTRRGHPNALA